MNLDVVGTAKSWHEAFETARRLLVEDQLAAVAVVSEKEYAGGRYVASQLREFEATMGCVDAVLDNLERMSHMLYGEKHSLRLVHGPFKSNHPFSTENDWILVIVYED